MDKQIKSNLLVFMDDKHIHKILLLKRGSQYHRRATVRPVLTATSQFNGNGQTSTPTETKPRNRLR